VLANRTVLLLQSSAWTLSTRSRSTRTGSRAWRSSQQGRCREAQAAKSWIMSDPEPQANSQSSGSDFWSASDHSSLTESFHSWPSSEAESPTGPIEVDLIASETLSTSNGDSGASTATPTFSDLPDASQGVAPPESVLCTFGIAAALC